MAALTINEPPTRATSKAAYFRKRPPVCCSQAEWILARSFGQPSRSLEATSLERWRRNAARVTMLRQPECDRAEAAQATSFLRDRGVVIRLPCLRAQVE